VKLMPIVYVSDMGRAMDFYAALGFHTDVQDRASMWIEMSPHNGKSRDASLALHYMNPITAHDPKQSRVELALVSHERLETLAERLKAAGIALAREISDEAFGRSLAVRDPDGLYIQINEHDESLYT
jgi:predicted enzyme related to lactoylglutathione lyase